MRQSPDFLLREVAGSMVLMPIGKAVQNFPGMVTMNATSAFLWEQLAQEQTEQTLTAALMERYEVAEAKASEDVKKFLEVLTGIGAIL